MWNFLKESVEFTLFMWTCVIFGLFAVLPLFIVVAIISWIISWMTHG